MKRIVSLVMVLAMALSLAACGGVPKEKIEAIGTKYEALGKAYTAAVDEAKAIADLADQAGVDSDSIRNTFASAGTTLQELGTLLQNELDNMNEADVDVALTELDNLQKILDDQLKALAEKRVELEQAVDLLNEMNEVNDQLDQVNDALDQSGQAQGQDLTGVTLVAAGGEVNGEPATEDDLGDFAVNYFVFNDGSSFAMMDGDDEVVSEGEYFFDGAELQLTAAGSTSVMTYDEANQIFSLDLGDAIIYYSVQ